MLIGNKTDLKDNKVVDTEVARVIIQLFSFMLQNYAKNKKMQFFECSAKTADGVNNAFGVLARILLDKRYDKMRKS